MSKSKERKLTMQMVKEDVKKYDEVERIYFDDDAYIDMHPYFDPHKVANMLELIIDDLSVFRKEGIEINDEMFIHWIHFRIIKTFSKMYFPKETLKLYNFFLEFIRSRYYPQIMKLIPKEELENIYNQVIEMFKAGERILKESKKLEREIERLKQNHPELTEVIEKKNTQES